MPKPRSEKVSRALEILKANRQFSQDKVLYGLQRVDFHVEDIEGQWLEQWSDEGLGNSSIESNTCQKPYGTQYVVHVTAPCDALADGMKIFIELRSVAAEGYGDG